MEEINLNDMLAKFNRNNIVVETINIPNIAEDEEYGERDIAEEDEDDEDDDGLRAEWVDEMRDDIIVAKNKYIEDTMLKINRKKRKEELKIELSIEMKRDKGVSAEKIEKALNKKKKRMNQNYEKGLNKIRSRLHRIYFV